MIRSRTLRRVLPLLVLVAAVAIAGGLIKTSPEAKRNSATQTGFLVEVTTLNPAPHRLDVTAKGTVQAAQEVTVQPQVSGRIVEASEQLIPGGLFRAGQVLFNIEPDDFRLAVAAQRAALAEAEARLALEEGRRRVAEREWELFQEELEPDQDSALARREPQLRQAMAAVETAKARLAQAELQLERTEVKAPWNAFVRSETVEVGQTVSSQSQTVRLVGTDVFWVQAAVPADRITYIDIPGVNAVEGSLAKIRYDAGGQEVERDGRVLRLLGDLDPAGRMARLLIAVRDPLGQALRATGDTTEPPLLLDSYVDVLIEGNRTEMLTEIPRAWLRENDQAWVYDDGQLSFRDLEIVWRLEDSVLVRGSLEAGDPIITSAMATPIEGMQLRLADDGPESETGVEIELGSSSGSGAASQRANEEAL